MIERATLDHADMLARTGVGVLQDLPNYKDVPYDPEHTLRTIQTYLHLPQIGCFFKQVNGEVVGFFLGIIGDQWFTPQKEMSEIMFWVRKDYRSTSLARDLIKAMEVWAKEQGAVKLFIAAGSGYETARVEKFYNRLGYKTTALTTCKEI